MSIRREGSEPVDRGIKKRLGKAAYLIEIFQNLTEGNDPPGNQRCSEHCSLEFVLIKLGNDGKRETSERSNGCDNILVFTRAWPLALA